MGLGSELTDTTEVNMKWEAFVRATGSGSNEKARLGLSMRRGRRL